MRNEFLVRKGLDERKYAGMGGQDSWKRTEDIEIDLADLIRKLCMQWKQILICAIAAAVILGGYGYLKQKKSQDVFRAGDFEEEKMTEEEEQSVIAAIDLETEISGLKEYLDNSLLMQIDPYHKNRAVLLYSIECKNWKKLQQTAENYLSFVINGGAADEIKKSEGGIWDIDKSYLAELITGYQKSGSSPYQAAINGTEKDEIPAETFFYVELTGKDTKTVRQLSLGMQAALKKHSIAVKEAAGEHSLTLLSSQENIVADSDLQTQQHAKRTLLTTNLASLKTMLNAFNKQQMAVYEDAAGTAERQDSDEEIVTASDSDISIKYTFLGLAGGVFIYCLIFGFRYLCCDTLKSVKEMKRLYTFPYYGSIFLEDRQKGKEQTLSGAGNGGSDETVQALNRIRLACKKQGIMRLCMASDFLLSEREKECLDGIAEKLGNCGIDVFVAEKASSDAAVWDALAETGNVLIVSKIGMTTHGAVDEEMGFYLENAITVAGAVAFASQKKYINRNCE